jgi:hypothetical protein
VAEFGRELYPAGDQLQEIAQPVRADNLVHVMRPADIRPMLMADDSGLLALDDERL